MDNGQPHTTTTYSVVMQALQGLPAITYLEAVPRTLQLGSVSIHVLPMPPYAGSNLNNSSVGLVIEYGEFRAFLSGDPERRELQHFVQSGVVPDVTLLKAPHHGSDDAVSEGFLRVANPELVVISVGRGNRYGHPKASAVYTYDRYAEQVLRTDVRGEITVSGYHDGRYQLALGETVVAEGAERSIGSESIVVLPPSPVPEERVPRPRSEQPGTGPNVAITVFADAPGNDHNNLNGEYAILVR